MPPTLAQHVELLTSRGVHFRMARIDDHAYPYALYTPPNHNPRTPTPTIVFLHGVGECGADGIRQIGPGLGRAVLEHPSRWPFLILLPQKPDHMRPWEAYEPFLMRMLDQTRLEHTIDPDRLILTGVSQGGAGAWALAAAHPDLWSAIVPICGYGSPRALAPAVKHLPIWAFHGEADPTVPYQATTGIIDAITDLGGHPRITIYPDVEHDSWTPAYADPELPEWLLQQRRGHPPSPPTPPAPPTSAQLDDFPPIDIPLDR